MVGAFLVTFLVTRFVTQAIRRGWGPFRDASIGGVHVHHEVYGIFLLLGTGTAEFTYQPGPPVAHLLAVLFGVGAALTLDEFALWLRLDDVYWSREGRSSVDAVLVALVVGCLLLVGANPFDADRADGEGVIALTVALNLLFSLLAILKGRVVLGVVGVFLLVVAFVAALRLARPQSPWARRWYRPGSRRWRRSHARSHPGTATGGTGWSTCSATPPPSRRAGSPAHPRRPRPRRRARRRPRRHDRGPALPHHRRRRRARVGRQRESGGRCGHPPVLPVDEGPTDRWTPRCPARRPVDRLCGARAGGIVRGVGQEPDTTRPRQ